MIARGGLKYFFILAEPIQSNLVNYCKTKRFVLCPPGHPSLALTGNYPERSLR